MALKELPDSEYIKTFTCCGLSICRGDFENLGCPLYTANIDDDTMQKIVNDIYIELSNYYRFTDEEIAEYGKHYDLETMEAIDEAFYREMEDIALQYGMKYYDEIEEN